MSHLFAQADAVQLPLADKSIDLVFGSPPYQDARTYGINADRDCLTWVEWMLTVTEEALRVTRGAVLWIVAGCTRNRNYQPGPEGLLWEGHHRGWYAECPCYWHRVGIPGSGGNQWFRKDVEYVLCFKAVAELPWSDNTAMGHPPKWEPGGKMSHRLTNGTRVNRELSRAERGARRAQLVADGFGHRLTARDTECDANARPERSEWNYVPPAKANPGNLICGNSGGGKLGHPLAYENEAPFPEYLAEWFIRSFCPPGGIVLDPFSGSGTTVVVADRLRRHGIGLDIRRSQAELGTRRIERPHQPIKRSKKRGGEYPLFDE